MVYRRDVIAVLSAGPRTASSLARELGLRRGDMNEELQRPSIRPSRRARRPRRARALQGVRVYVRRDEADPAGQVPVVPRQPAIRAVDRD